MTTLPNTTNLENNVAALHSDEALMLLYCDGDYSAFRELYQRHSADLYRFIAWKSPRQDWVNEIIQDSWIALHQSRATYQVKAQFRSYLYLIAKNKLIDLLRQHPELLASELVCEKDIQQVEQGIEKEQHHLAATPENNLMHQQTQNALYRAIAALPSEQKEAIVLQQFNELSIEEIANMSEVSVETIKSRLRYAMQKLRSHLQVAPVKNSRQEVKL